MNRGNGCGTARSVHLSSPGSKSGCHGPRWGILTDLHLGTGLPDSCCSHMLQL